MRQAITVTRARQEPIKAVIDRLNNKENNMGRKGVSKRKPKGSKSFSNDQAREVRPGQTPSVQDLVKGKDAALNSGNTNSYTGANKKNKKGK